MDTAFQLYLNMVNKNTGVGHVEKSSGTARVDKLRFFNSNLIINECRRHFLYRFFMSCMSVYSAVLSVLSQRRVSFYACMEVDFRFFLKQILFVIRVCGCA